MSAHTPGPWVLQGFRIYGPLDSRSKHGNGRALIGGVVDDGIDWRATQLEVDGRGAFYAESMANARLMVTAPDLLEVCRSALAGLSQGACLTCGAEPGCNIDCPGCAWVTKAEAAIAKAEGRHD